MLMLEQIDLVDIDFFVTGDINEAFDALRERDPVHWQERQPGRGFWSLTRYDDVLAAYRDPLGLSSERGGESRAGASGGEASGEGRSTLLCSLRFGLSDEAVVCNFLIMPGNRRGPRAAREMSRKIYGDAVF